MPQYEVFSGNVERNGKKLVLFNIRNTEQKVIACLLSPPHCKTLDEAQFWCDIFNEIPAVMKCASI